MGASLDVPLVGVKLPLIMLHLLRGVPGSSISENEIFEDNLGKIWLMRNSVKWKEWVMILKTNFHNKPAEY